MARKKAARAAKPTKKQTWVPHAYQSTVLDAMDDRGKLALLLDPGMGKTSICLEDFRRRLDFMDAKRALVVAPLRTCQTVWPLEIKKWANFKDLTCAVLHGSQKTVKSADRVQISVINPEGLAWIVKNAKQFRNWWDCIYVDESTYFKTASSKRSKNLYKIIHKLRGGITYKFILTGTPAPNGVADLYGQFGALDPKILGSTLSQFRRDFKFTQRHAPWGVIHEPGKESEDLINAAIAPHSVRLDAKDHLNMPDLVLTKRIVKLPAPARKIYQDLENDMFAELDGGEVMAVNPGVLSSKCRQLANGAIYLSPDGEAAPEETRKVEYVHHAKAIELGNLWEELGRKPLLCAYEFKHDLTTIKHYFKEQYKFEPRYIGGGCSTEEVQQSVEQWNAGDLPMLLVNPQSAAHGLNLQTGGHHLCWYSLPWSLEHYLQLNGRLWRQGQEQGVFIHHLIADKTIDEVVFKAIEDKNSTQLKLLSYLRDYRR
ncbi:MAG TPA: DEAD/DEAH box helicase [Planctomycetes bacterium]|jgi:SNF2 family DNA or RNA helicase|nr:DEAD/DEAH box helicase [Planctomycetota bacterium]